MFIVVGQGGARDGFCHDFFSCYCDNHHETIKLREKEFTLAHSSSGGEIRGHMMSTIRKQEVMSQAAAQLPFYTYLHSPGSYVAPPTEGGPSRFKQLNQTPTTHRHAWRPIFIPGDYRFSGADNSNNHRFQRSLRKHGLSETWVERKMIISQA